MNYVDQIYGLTSIAEPVLLDLIGTAAVQRLKGVQQHGISGLLGVTTPITRFDHSVGTMLLVRQLGGSLLEQIAALLHDVSHTAFSHVIDYVFDDHDGQSYHDEKKGDYLAGTDIPSVLAEHGYDWHLLLDDARFPLLEQPSPRLCADRLDYFLRDSVGLGLGGSVEIADVLSNLLVHEGRIATGNARVARWLAYNYIAADDRSWANLREVGLYEVTARAIRHGLRAGVISEADFWGTDASIWARLQAAQEPELQRWLNLAHADTRFTWDDERPTFRISTKLRTIDPDVLVEGHLLTYSDLDPEFARFRSDYLARKSGKWPIRVIAANRPAPSG